MSCKWKPDLRKNEYSHLQTRHAAIAYMDDTTWIARSKKDMDNILEEARRFYEANDSQVNGAKSVLITINNPSLVPATVQIGTKKEQVLELNRKEHARFLGI